MTQPRTQSPLRQGRRGLSKSPGVRRVDRAGQAVEEVCVLAQQARGPGQDGHRVAARHFCQQRHQLVTDPVTAETELEIGGVGDGLEADRGHKRPGLRAPQFEYRDA